MVLSMKNKFNKIEIRQWILPVVILLIACILIMGSSPLYITNPWVDSNAMFTMGRAFLHGYVPFKDIIDQRGPMLYLLFAVGAVVRENNFFGIFLIQTVNMLTVYVLTWKLANTFKTKIIDAKWLALLGPLVLMATNAYSLGGSPEEFAFTSILYLLLVINRAKQNVDNISLKEFFLLGINLSWLFWVKYSTAGAYVAFFIWTAMYLLFKKKYRKVLRVIVTSLLGFSIITILVLLYFSFNNAVGDLIKIYFVQNMTAYGQTNNAVIVKLMSLLFLMGQEIGAYRIVSLLILSGWIKALYDRKNITLELVVFLGTILFVAMQHRLIQYYNLVWITFLVVALLRLVNVKLPNFKNQQAVKIMVVSALILLPFVNNQDLYRLVIKGAGVSVGENRYNAQPKFAKIMHQKEKNPSLLLINDLDNGFYLSAQTLPTTKYWQKLNMNYQQLPQMYEAFNTYMRNKQVDFVIIKVDVPLAPDRQGQYRQIPGFIDSHLDYELLKNYRIESALSNKGDDNYILMYKK